MVVVGGDRYGEGGRGGEGRDYLCFFHVTIRCELNPRLQTLSSGIAVTHARLFETFRPRDQKRRRSRGVLLKFKRRDCF